MMTTFDPAILTARLQLAQMIEGALRRQNISADRSPAVVETIHKHVQAAAQHGHVPARANGTFTQDVVDEIVGYGPLEPLLKDTSVTEIMVNGPHQVYIEQEGKVHLSQARFLDDAHVARVINRIVAPLGRRVDASSPLVDARLPDGSRVNAIVPPCAIDGPSITIRKFPEDRLGMPDLLRFGSLDEDMATILEAAVVSKLNIVISGGTGSGKTTLLNVLSGYIPAGERIVTIENAAELKLHQPHVVRLETRPAYSNGDRSVTVRELVINSLRMRPERIVVGECRGGEALDMLQAMNTGHDGSLTTVHANTPRDAISRLETLVLMAGMDLPVRIVRQQIASAIQMIVQIARLRDGTRKVTSISEVTGIEGENVVMQELWKFDEKGQDSKGRVIGEFAGTGLRPFYNERLEMHGFKLPARMFLRRAATTASMGRR
jgi:pilus assembly protein CpaF